MIALLAACVPFPPLETLTAEPPAGVLSGLLVPATDQGRGFSREGATARATDALTWVGGVLPATGTVAPRFDIACRWRVAWQRCAASGVGWAPSTVFTDTVVRLGLVPAGTTLGAVRWLPLDDGRPALQVRLSFDGVPIRRGSLLLDLPDQPIAPERVVVSPRFTRAAPGCQPGRVSRGAVEAEASSELGDLPVARPFERLDAVWSARDGVLRLVVPVEVEARDGRWAAEIEVDPCPAEPE